MDHAEHNSGIDGAHFSDDKEGIEALVEARKAVSEISKRIVGQEDVLELLLTSLFARGRLYWCA